MDFKCITLDDKDLIESYLQKSQYKVSDISFTNLYLWHFSRDIRFYEMDDSLFIKTTYPNQEPFLFMPLGNANKKKGIKAMMEYFNDQKWTFSIHSLSEEMKAELETLMPKQFEYTYNRDRSDYIYNTQELIELKGRKFHKKKNHVNQFYEAYPHYSYEQLGERNQDELLEVWKTWFEKHPNPTDGLKNEHIGICHAIKNYNRLSFKTGILRVNGNIVAFSLGEPLNQDTVVIHIEKADINYQGSFQAINQLFLKHEWSQYPFVNREEDLGIEGLRKAKLSYHPHSLIDKYDAVFKNTKF